MIFRIQYVRAVLHCPGVRLYCGITGVNAATVYRSQVGWLSRVLGRDLHIYTITCSDKAVSPTVQRIPRERVQVKQEKKCIGIWDGMTKQELAKACNLSEELFNEAVKEEGMFGIKKKLLKFGFHCNVIQSPTSLGMADRASTGDSRHGALSSVRDNRSVTGATTANREKADSNQAFDQTQSMKTADNTTHRRQHSWNHVGKEFFINAQRDGNFGKAYYGSQNVTIKDKYEAKRSTSLLNFTKKNDHKLQLNHLKQRLAKHETETRVKKNDISNEQFIEKPANHKTPVAFENIKKVTNAITQESILHSSKTSSQLVKETSTEQVTMQISEKENLQKNKDMNHVIEPQDDLLHSRSKKAKVGSSQSSIQQSSIAMSEVAVDKQREQALGHKHVPPINLPEHVTISNTVSMKGNYSDFGDVKNDVQLHGHVQHASPSGAQEHLINWVTFAKEITAIHKKTECINESDERERLIEEVVNATTQESILHSSNTSSKPMKKTSTGQVTKQISKKKKIQKKKHMNHVIEPQDDKVTNTITQESILHSSKTSSQLVKETSTEKVTMKLSEKENLQKNTDMNHVIEPQDDMLHSRSKKTKVGSSQSSIQRSSIAMPEVTFDKQRAQAGVIDVVQDKHEDKAHKNRFTAVFKAVAVSIKSLLSKNVAGNKFTHESKGVGHKYENTLNDRKPTKIAKIFSEITSKMRTNSHKTIVEDEKQSKVIRDGVIVNVEQHSVTCASQPIVNEATDTVKADKIVKPHIVIISSKPIEVNVTDDIQANKQSVKQHSVTNASNQMGINVTDEILANKQSVEQHGMMDNSKPIEINVASDINPEKQLIESVTGNIELQDSQTAEYVIKHDINPEKHLLEPMTGNIELQDSQTAEYVIKRDINPEKHLVEPMTGNIELQDSQKAEYVIKHDINPEKHLVEPMTGNIELQDSQKAEYVMKYDTDLTMSDMGREINSDLYDSVYDEYEMNTDIFHESSDRTDNVRVYMTEEIDENSYRNRFQISLEESLNNNFEKINHSKSSTTETNTVQNIVPQLFSQTVTEAAVDVSHARMTQQEDTDTHVRNKCDKEDLTTPQKTHHEQTNVSDNAVHSAKKCGEGMQAVFDDVGVNETTHSDTSLSHVNNSHIICEDFNETGQISNWTESYDYPLHPEKLTITEHSTEKINKDSQQKWKTTDVNYRTLKGHPTIQNNMQQSNICSEMLSKNVLPFHKKLHVSVSPQNYRGNSEIVADAKEAEKHKWNVRDNTMSNETNIADRESRQKLPDNTNIGVHAEHSKKAPKINWPHFVPPQKQRTPVKTMKDEPHGHQTDKTTIQIWNSMTESDISKALRISPAEARRLFLANPRDENAQNVRMFGLKKYINRLGYKWKLEKNTPTGQSREPITSNHPPPPQRDHLEDMNHPPPPQRDRLEDINHPPPPQRDRLEDINHPPPPQRDRLEDINHPPPPQRDRLEDINYPPPPQRDRLEDINHPPPPQQDLLEDIDFDILQQMPHDVGKQMNTGAQLVPKTKSPPREQVIIRMPPERESHMSRGEVIKRIPLERESHMNHEVIKRMPSERQTYMNRDNLTDQKQPLEHKIGNVINPKSPSQQQQFMKHSHQIVTRMDSGTFEHNSDIVKRIPVERVHMRNTDEQSVRNIQPFNEMASKQDSENKSEQDTVQNVQQDTKRKRNEHNVQKVQPIFGVVSKVDPDKQMQKAKQREARLLALNQDWQSQPPADPSVLVKRSPIITIMGHVDHGKTTLLDALRETHVVDQEFGGITQHVGAFKVKLPSGEVITFLDTPGHAAFSAMRARGAMVTDIIVLVVAAEDGVMPQTIESIHHAKESGVPVIVAINKIDKPGVDMERIKRELLAEDVVLEDYGGDIQSVPISALKRINLDQLLESISVQAELMDLKADPLGLVEARVVEARTDAGKGRLVTALIQRGTLKPGNFLVAGTTWTKVRMIYDDQGKVIQEAGPATPVEITGWRELPTVGEEILQVPTEKLVKHVVSLRAAKKLEEKAEDDALVIEESREEHHKQYSEARKGLKALSKKFRRKITTSDLLYKHRADDSEVPELAIVVKADVDGSLEALLHTLDTYACDKCRLNIVHFAVGDVIPADLEMAATFGGQVYCFHVKEGPNVEKSPHYKDVPIKHFNVIYKMFDDLEETLNSKLPTKTEEEIIGEGRVMEVFDISSRKTTVAVAGCRCTSGTLVKKNQFRITRDGQTVYEGPIMSLKHHKKDVTTIKTDVECGLCIDPEHEVQFKPGDLVTCFITKSLRDNIVWDLGF